MPRLITTTPRVSVRATAVSAMDNNVYLLTSRRTGEQILIDAAADPAAIATLLDAARADGPDPAVRLIVTTHRHWDHIRALAEVAGSTGARSAAGRADAAAIETETGVGADRLLDDGDRLGVAGIDLDVIGLRGHTAGSIALAYAEDGQPVHLFTGDSLFPGGVGNTGGNRRRFTGLLADVTARLFAAYGDDAIVHPGHGLPTTLGAERPHLDEWAARGW
jgi:glyoxylase-like metal-dependent hydrolase (beta-lactamase superfamily II)